MDLLGHRLWTGTTTVDRQFVIEEWSYNSVYSIGPILLTMIGYCDHVEEDDHFDRVPIGVILFRL